MTSSINNSILSRNLAWTSEGTKRRFHVPVTTFQYHINRHRINASRVQRSRLKTSTVTGSYGTDSPRAPATSSFIYEALRASSSRALRVRPRLGLRNRFSEDRV